ncbi:hypothetical protein TorRG33x02_060230, partial [Trema orientale]
CEDQMKRYLETLPTRTSASSGREGLLHPLELKLHQCIGWHGHDTSHAAGEHGEHSVGLVYA